MTSEIVYPGLAPEPSWMDDAGGSFWKPEVGRQYTVLFHRAPVKSVNPFKDGEDRWELDIDVEGVPLKYAPGRRFLGALKAAFQRAGETWPLTCTVQKYGEGMRTTWAIVPITQG